MANTFLKNTKFMKPCFFHHACFYVYFINKDKVD
jgi:hypothetical protein